MVTVINDVANPFVCFFISVASRFTQRLSFAIQAICNHISTLLSDCIIQEQERNSLSTVSIDCSLHQMPLGVTN